MNLSGLDYGEVPGCTYVHQRTDLAGIAALDLVTGQLSRNERGWPQHPNCIVVPSEWQPAEAGTTTQQYGPDSPCRPSGAPRKCPGSSLSQSRPILKFGNVTSAPSSPVPAREEV